MSGRRRWIIGAALLALLLIIVTFPMRLALSLSGAGDAGIAAREVRGSVWSGALIDARLGVLPLGTVRARLSPLALLGGDTELGFTRADEGLGALSGRLHGSDPRGMSDVNGVTSLSGGLGIVPVDTIRFEGVSVRFDGAGQCVEAAGRLQLMMTAPIAGLDLSRGLSGPIACANGRARAMLASQSGMERLTLSFDVRGAYRAQFAINVDRDPAMAAALTVLGFRPGANGYVLTATGRF